MLFGTLYLSKQNALIGDLVDFVCSWNVQFKIPNKFCESTKLEKAMFVLN